MIDNSWTFQDIIKNIEAIRTFFNSSCASFCYFDKHSLIVFKRNFKATIYSLNASDSQKDKIWQYLNGDELDEPLEYLIKGKNRHV